MASVGSAPDAGDNRDLFFDAPDALPMLDFASSAPTPTNPPATTLRRRLPRRTRAVAAVAATPDSVPSGSTSASTVTADLSATPAGVESGAEATSAPPVPPSRTDVAPVGSLEFAVDLVIKAIVLQLSLLFNLITFPIRTLHWSFLLLTHPQRTSQRVFTWVSGALSSALEKGGTAVHRQLGGDGSVGRAAGRVAWGLLWSAYVFTVLISLLGAAFVGTSLTLGKLLEKPVRVKETLIFDYTKVSPAAVVLLPAEAAALSRKLQLTISLTLPESDHNCRLGVFQVKVELLSANDSVLSRASQPSMLRFKSHHLHLMETLLKSVYLLSGYSSEAQTITLKFRGFPGGPDNPRYIRVVLEQRAEFQPGAGIPAIYEASVKIESQIPLLKRIIWSWRRTLFVWISMGLFVLELAIALLCCNPAAVPRSRHCNAEPR